MSRTVSDCCCSGFFLAHDELLYCQPYRAPQTSLQSPNRTAGVDLGNIAPPSTCFETQLWSKQLEKNTVGPVVRFADMALVEVIGVASCCHVYKILMCFEVIDGYKHLNPQTPGPSDVAGDPR
jgi:hypothetical protein